MGIRRKMKHRIVLIAALLTVLGTVSGASATAAQSATAQPQSATTPYYIHNEQLGCIADPGHGNVVYVRFTCTTYVNFIDPETFAGYTWYLIEMNGDPATCLNVAPDGFYYADSCEPGDIYELFEHHVADQLGVYAPSLGINPNILSTCNDTGNSRLTIIPNPLPSDFIPPPGCNYTNDVQWTWEIETG
jgi:hypothetical protein